MMKGRSSKEGTLLGRRTEAKGKGRQSMPVTDKQRKGVELASATKQARQSRRSEDDKSVNMFTECVCVGSVSCDRKAVVPSSRRRSSKSGSLVRHHVSNECST